MTEKITLLEFLKKELPDLIINSSADEVNKRYPFETQDYRMGFVQGYLDGANLVQRLIIGLLDENSEDMKKFLEK